MDGDLIAVVVLDHLDVPGYGSYKHGDVAGFERSVAETLIQQHRARRLQEAPRTTPAPSVNALPEQAPKPPVAEPTTLAPLPKPVLAVAASSPRAQEAEVGTYLSEPRLRNLASSAETEPAMTASSLRLAEAVTFLRRVLRTPRPATEVLALAHQCGISLATLRRAKRALGVKAQKVGMRAGWVWVVPRMTLNS